MAKKTTIGKSAHICMETGIILVNPQGTFDQAEDLPHHRLVEDLHREMDRKVLKIMDIKVQEQNHQEKAIISQRM